MSDSYREKGSGGSKTSATPQLANRISVLTVLAGGPPGGIKVYRLHKNRLIIGSVDSADVRIVGPGISPIHAVLELGEQPTIFDLASDSGVLVNGQKLVTQDLKVGDRIKIGSYEFKYENQEMEAAGAEMPRGQPSQGQPSRQKFFRDPQEDLTPLLLVELEDVEDIFDYRASEQLALEVVMSWHGTILDVEHFSGKKQVLLGSDKGSDFAIPPFFSGKRFILATRMGEEYSLNLDGKMQGMVHRSRQMDPIGGKTQSIAFNRGDYAKITIGEVDFYLSYTPAPPTLKRQRMLERDPFFYKVATITALLSAVTLFGISKLTVNPQIEAEQLPERIATILYQPEKYQRHIPTVPEPKVVEEKIPEPKKIEPPKPKPVPPKKIEIKPKPVDLKKPIPKEMELREKPKPVPPKKVEGQNKSKEGEGARAKGKEGTRGTKTAAVNPDHQQKARRPSPQGGPGAGGSNSQVGKEGNVEMLKGQSDQVKDILGAATAKLGSGGSQLKGYGGFDTQGNGGLALSGSGTGGGGKVESLGGLGDKGIGGGRVGTGLGAVGDGTGIVGGRSRIVPRRGGAEEAVVVGSIDSDAIERAILAHKDEFRLCYEKEINAETPKLAGRVSTSFVIGASGRVLRAGVLSTSLNNPNAEKCVLVVLKRIEFPIPKGGTEVQVSYPFKFSPTGK